MELPIGEDAGIQELQSGEDAGIQELQSIPTYRMLFAGQYLPSIAVITHHEIILDDEESFAHHYQ